MSPGMGERYPGDLLPHISGSGTHFLLLRPPLPTPWSLGVVSAAGLCWALVNTLSLKSHPPTIWTWSHNASSSCNSVQLAKLFHFPCVHACLVAQSCPILCNPLSCIAHQTPLFMDVPGKNTGEDCHFLLQGIFPIQESNLSFLWLLHCRQILSTFLKFRLNIQRGPTGAQKAC